jgi:HEAT repeat protein
MRKRVRITLAVLLVALVGLVVWQVLREPEPVYQGKGLRTWLRECRESGYIGLEEQVEAPPLARHAVRTIGTNAIPFLLKMLGKKDSSVVAGLVAFWNRHLVSLPLWLRHPPWYVNQAAFVNSEGALGFEFLGRDAEPAVPALIALYERNISPDSQVATSRALNAIGPEAQGMAIPSFLRAAASSNAPVREVAVMALFLIDAAHADHRKVVPALVNALSDTNFFIRLVAANGLGRFGTNAQQAVPALARLLSDPDSRVRRVATNALKKIDPEAASKVGVK